MSKQIIALWLGIAIAVALALYPPWETQSNRAWGPRSMGYGFIGSPPIERSGEYVVARAGGIDVARLLVELGLVGLVTGGAIIGFKSQGKESSRI